MKIVNLTNHRVASILTVEDELGQRMNVIIGVCGIIFHTIADAKRYLNGDEHYTYAPMTDRYFVKKFADYANERYIIDGGTSRN